ncbi:MAG: hypothetical protein QM771_04570 [Nitrospira sp.]
MKLANERLTGRSVPVDKDLGNLLSRLDRLAVSPGFAQQRQVAFERAMPVYVELGSRSPLSPLRQEVELADLLLYADFYPDDGQLTPHRTTARRHGTYPGGRAGMARSAGRRLPGSG